MLANANMLDPITKIIRITNIFNMLGTINLVAEVYALARAICAVSLVDGAQLLPHSKVHVQSLGLISSLFPDIKFLQPPVLTLLTEEVT